MAEADWIRLAAVGAQDRVVLVADRVWALAYVRGRRMARWMVAAGVVSASLTAAAQQAGSGSDALLCLLELADAAQHVQGMEPGVREGLPGPADLVTLGLALAVQPSGPRGVAAVAWRRGHLTGTAHGVLEAATDIRTCWRSRICLAALAETWVSGQPLRDWADGTLARATRSVVRALLPELAKRAGHDPAGHR
jgi:hypothetical protein